MDERRKDNLKTVVMYAVLFLVMYGLLCCAFGK